MSLAKQKFLTVIKQLTACDVRTNVAPIHGANDYTKEWEIQLYLLAIVEYVNVPVVVRQ
jgi:hypothetical protein